MLLIYTLTKNKKRTAYLDRTDSSKGYVEGNVQLVHKDVNISKNKYELQYFINLCKDVSKNFGKEEFERYKLKTGKHDAFSLDLRRGN